MKHYVVTNTKVLIETFRVDATSRDDAIRRVMAGDESGYDVKIVKQTWAAASDVSPRKPGAS